MDTSAWLRMVVLPSVGLGAVAFGGCSRGPGKRDAAPPAPPITVMGTMVEGYSGRPLTTGEVILGHGLGGRFRIAFAARPDASGRFRFDGVHATELLSVQWKPDEAAKKTALEVPPHLLGQDHLQNTQANPGWGDLPYVEVDKAGGRDVDLGTATVWFETAAQELFAPVCETGRPSASVPAQTGVVVFARGEDGFAVAGYWHQDVASAWPAAWKGVVCITEARKKLGTYSEYGIGEGSTAAYSVIWKVSVIRLPDGKTFRTTITADPPRQIQVDRLGQPVNRGDRDVAGDPRPKLREWLQSLAP
jgi:hypothetical protein